MLVSLKVNLNKGLLMIFVKLVEAGWENYTGYLGDIEFVDGISVELLGRHKINRIAAGLTIISVTKLPDGSTQDGVIVGPLSELLAIQEQKGITVETLPTLEELGEQDNFNLISTQAIVELNPTPSQYTREQLEAIADAQGVKGLREIGDSLDIKAKSIEGLIDGILESGN
jgi:hypothetical protein